MAKKTKHIGNKVDKKPVNKGGRPRIYTPESMRERFDEYVKQTKANPRYSSKVLSDGSIISYPIERPLTLVGFCVFEDIAENTFREYEKREEFFGVCAHVRARIESDQLEGAMCEQYNPSIASRVLHLADRQDVTTNGKDLLSNNVPISVVLDPEAAKIIQSIGKQTIDK